MNLLRAFALTLVVFLAACSTSLTPANLETAASFKNAPDKGLLVVDMSADVFCRSAKLTLADENKKVTTLLIQTIKKGGPAVKTLEPGRYKLVHGACSNLGNLTGFLPDLRIWFGDFTVEAGQATYAGTIVAKNHEMKTRREGLDAVTGFLNLDTNKEVNFVTYRVENRLDEVVDRMGPELSDLSAQLVYRPPLVFLDETEFEAAIIRAYAQTDKEKNPTQAQVDARIGTEVQTALTRSLITLRERNPDYKGNFSQSLPVTDSATHQGTDI